MQYLIRSRKLIFIIAVIISNSYMGVNGQPLKSGDLVIFTYFTGNSIYDEILSASEIALANTCNAAGRMIPVEYNYRKAAIEKSAGPDADTLYMNAAQYLNAKIYAVLTAYDSNGDYALTLRLIPIKDEYRNLKREVTLYSKIPANIPLKASREFANILKTLPLQSDIVKTLPDGSAVIDAGQWHGLEPGKYKTDLGIVEVKNISRYESTITGLNFDKIDSIEFKVLPNLKSYIKKIEYNIKENSAKTYSMDDALDKKGGRIKESINGICIVNMGASACLPGYGSFLAAEYMGIEKGKVDYGGIFITSALMVTHLGLVPYMTDFKVNFFPWVKDSGRTDRMKRLNYFMWGTIPLTFTASFFSQLSYNYTEKDILPPQFEDCDTAAAVVSVFVPGGGMFYKGYRWTGWGIYIGEMTLMGSAVYAKDKKKRNILIGSLAALKCIEIAASYIITPSYSFFRKEISHSDSINFFVGIDKDYNNGNEFTAAISLSF